MRREIQHTTVRVGISTIPHETTTEVHHHEVLHAPVLFGIAEGELNREPQLIIVAQTSHASVRPLLNRETCACLPVVWWRLTITTTFNG
ncbi:MAG: hypothetical protein WCK70_17720 [Chloroflexales bacterium]